MVHIVDSLRKHQKMIILGAALGVIVLYIIPVDQIVSAVSPPRLARAIQHIQDTRDRLSIRLASHPDVLAQIDAQLAGVQSQLDDVQYRLLAL